MPYIPIANELPGIIGLLETYTETGTILKTLANALLNKHTEAFNKSERETVASYISYLNMDYFEYARAFINIRVPLFFHPCYNKLHRLVRVPFPIHQHIG